MKGTIAAGDTPEEIVKDGTCIEIYTGSIMPEGIDKRELDRIRIDPLFTLEYGKRGLIG